MRLATYLPSRAVALLCLLVGLHIFGCSDDTEAPDGWQLGDLGEWQRQDLEGPPGSSYHYRGRIGERLYFSAKARELGGYPNHWRAFSYSPVEGWRYESGLEQILADSDTRSRDMIQEFDGAQYYLDDQFEPVLNRSVDGGETWQTMPLPESVVAGQANVDHLTSDGHALYVLVLSGDLSESDELWRLDPDGEGWTQLRDDIDKRGLSSGPGVVAAPVENENGWHISASVDGGQTWQTWEENHLDSQRRWVAYQGGYVFPHTSGSDAPPKIGRMSADGEFEEVEVEGAPGDIDRLLGVGDDVFADTIGGGIGRLVDGLRRYEPVSLPDPGGMYSTAFYPTFFELDDQTLGVVADTGMWKTSDLGERWSFIGHGYSNVSEVVEADGQTLARLHDRLYRLDDGEWVLHHPELDSPRMTLTKCANRFLLSKGDNDLYAYDVASDATEIYWENPDFDGEIWSGIPSVLCVNDEVFIGTAGTQMNGDGERGGLFKREGNTFVRLDEGFPGEQSPVVTSLVYHDGGLWVQTNDSVIWHVSPETGEWTRAHQNLPEDPSRHSGERVNDLLSTPNGLFARSDTQVWQRQDGSWRPVLTDAFVEEAGVTGAQWSDEGYVVGLTHIQGGLLVATSSGLYVVAPATGEFEVFDADFDMPIIDVANHVSGIYVSTLLGGLERYEPQY
jgi:hypothetical protein